MVGSVEANVGEQGNTCSFWPTMATFSFWPDPANGLARK